jgi:hypothetical protein
VGIKAAGYLQETVAASSLGFAVSLHLASEFHPQQYSLERRLLLHSRWRISTRRSNSSDSCSRESARAGLIQVMGEFSGSRRADVLYQGPTLVPAVRPNKNLGFIAPVLFVRDAPQQGLKPSTLFLLYGPTKVTALIENQNTASNAYGAALANTGFSTRLSFRV